MRESEHEERIDEKKLLKVVRKNFNIVWYKPEYTPLRSVLIIIASKLGIKDQSGNLIKIIISLDNIIINTLGRFLKSFSGGAVTIIGIKK